jgi:hypothetical protein
MIPFLPELPVTPALPLPASALPANGTGAGAGAGVASGGGLDFAALLGAAALPRPFASSQGATEENRPASDAASLPLIAAPEEAAPAHPRVRGQEVPALPAPAAPRLPGGRILPEAGETLPPPLPQAAAALAVAVPEAHRAPPGIARAEVPMGQLPPLAGAAAAPAPGPSSASDLAPAPAPGAVPEGAALVVAVAPSALRIPARDPQPPSVPTAVSLGAATTSDFVTTEAPRQAEPAETGEAAEPREPAQLSAPFAAAPDLVPGAPWSPPAQTGVALAASPEPGPAPDPVPPAVSVPAAAPVALAGALVVPAGGADAAAPAKASFTRGSASRFAAAEPAVSAAPSSSGPAAPVPSALPVGIPTLPEAEPDALSVPASGASTTPAAPTPAIPAPLPPATAPASQPAAESRPSDPAAPVETAIAQAGTLREALRAQRPEMVVRHAEFGMISLRLEPAAPDQWRAVLASRDPGFVPAIQAALAERAISPAQAPTDSGTAMGQNGTGEQRYGASPNGGQGSSQPYPGQSGGRDGEAAPDHRRPSTAAALAARAGEPEDDSAGASRAPGGLFA